MSRKWLAIGISALLPLGLAACGSDKKSDTGGGGSAPANVSGNVKIDGSSTVGPFAQAAAEEFQGQNPNTKISVGTSGTGGGFEKFCAGEIDISDASRPIKADEEVPICKKNGIKYQEIQIADDGIAVVTNKDLTIDCMTTAQLKQLWATDKVKSYDEVDPKFPKADVKLFGPGTDSGTFDFFTEEINGEKGKTRKDYQPSEDDNVLVQGVEGEKGGLGYFGFSYYEGNADKLNLVGVDGGSGCVKPSKETIQDGSYKPLARPLFMYVSEKVAAKPAVKAFLQYVLDNHESISDTSQVIAMTPEHAAKAKTAFQKAETNAK